MGVHSYQSIQKAPLLFLKKGRKLHEQLERSIKDMPSFSLHFFYRSHFILVFGQPPIEPLLGQWLPGHRRCMWGKLNKREPDSVMEGGLERQGDAPPRHFRVKWFRFQDTQTPVPYRLPPLRPALNNGPEWRPLP